MKYRFTFKINKAGQISNMFHDCKTITEAKKWAKSMGWKATDFRQLSKYPVI